MRVYKLILMLVLLAAVNTLAAQQKTASGVQMPDMPEMPGMPEMPSVSMDGTFYKPTLPSATPGKTKDKKTESENTKNTKSNEAILSEANSTTDIMTALLGENSSLLTASDISSLYDSGLFTGISSLNSTSSANYATTSTTNLLLQQVLNSLNELKAEQKKASSQEKTELEKKQADSNTFKNREPEILRFRINGYNIADSLTTVFFSDTEPDGTFLLTADRRYFVNQRTMTETFYMLFKAVSSKGSSVTYKVMPSIAQDHKNENSYVYRLAEIKNLTAEKTGNLVVMHFNSDDFTADLLLDIDKK